MDRAGVDGGTSANGDERGVGGFRLRLVQEAYGGGRNAEVDALAGAFEADEEIVLVESDGEVMHGNGAEIGKREGGIDFNPGLVEGDVAKVDVGGQPADLDGKAAGEGLAAGEDCWIGGEA